MATLALKDETKALITLLGGRKSFPGKVRDARDLQSALRKGLPYATFEAVVEVLGLKSEDLARILGVATRTLARRKTEQILTPIESDRLYRVARLSIRAKDVLGSIEKARTWLRRENPALGGHSPMSQLDTEIGEQQVSDLLNRIDYGVYS